MSESLTIHSQTGDYSVHFVDNVFESLARLDASGLHYVIDERVFGCYRNQLEPLLSRAPHTFIEPVETKKSYDYCGVMLQEFIAQKVRRTTRLLAIGGGITQDIVAFCSSILYRGIEWVYVPTTLLAQGDSCIGGKTSINMGELKNIVGNFNPPSQILIDPAFLKTLAVDDVKSGIGEMLHFYLYADSSMTDELFAVYPALLEDRALLRPFIRESLRIKQSVIEVDEYDKGERNKFNYGHTFGHALESITSYAIRHGQAVTVGMDIANFLSYSMGYMEYQVFSDIHDRLRINFPTYDLSRIDVNEYAVRLSKDKKNTDNDLTCILARRPGHLMKTKVPMDPAFIGRMTEYFRRILES